MELGHHERHWPQLRVKVYFLLVPLHIADHVQLVLSQVLDRSLLLFREFVDLGRELELSITELQLMLPTEAEGLGVFWLLLLVVENLEGHLLLGLKVIFLFANLPGLVNCWDTCL